MGVVIAEGCHHAVVVGAAPLAEEIGEPVHQHLSSGFLGIAEEQVLPCLLGLAVVPARVAADEGGLNGGREHHRAGIMVFFQGVQQGGSEAEVSFHELPGVLRPVHSRQVEDKIRIPAALFQKLCRRILVVEVKPVNGKIGSGSVRAVLQAVQSRSEIFPHESGGTSNQNVHSSSSLRPFPEWQPVLPGYRQGTEAFPSPAPHPAAGYCWN